jgi:type VI secretion system protein
MPPWSRAVFLALQKGHRVERKRLLERITNLQVETDRTHLTQAQVLTQSIVQHLQRILNTRRGSVPIDAEFGVPDFTNLAGSFATGETTQIIENMTRMIAATSLA